MARPRNPDEGEALFEQLVGDFSADPAVTPPSISGGGRFGASGLKVDGRIFAMLFRGELVVKLPSRRVDELVASGVGTPFERGHGSVMKEWVSIAPRHSARWGELALEARQFVAAAAPRGRPRSA